MDPITLILAGGLPVTVKVEFPDGDQAELGVVILDDPATFKKDLGDALIEMGRRFKDHKCEDHVHQPVRSANPNLN